MELEGSTLIIRRIHVKFSLECPPDQRDTAQRVHGFYAQSCPVYRSIHPQIAVTTEVAFR